MNTIMTILPLISDLAEIEGSPVVLLPAFTPSGKQPQNMCAILANSANSMNKSLTRLDEDNRCLWVSDHGFNEKWTLCAIVIEISLIDITYKVYGLFRLDAVTSRTQRHPS